MKTLILFVLCFWLLPSLPAAADEKTCWPCWDCLEDCERHAGKECCEKAKKECCKDCDNFRRYYDRCLYRTDKKERYSDHRTNELKSRFRQLVEEEMEKFNKLENQ